MLLLFGVLATLVIPVLALRGTGRRRLYFQVFAAAAPFGGLLLWLSQRAVDETADPNPVHLEGTVFMDQYFPIAGIVLLVAALQCVIAGLLRPPDARADAVSPLLANRALDN